MEYRQHLLLQGPQAGSMGPARIVGPYGLKQPNVPFPANSNGEWALTSKSSVPVPVLMHFSLMNPCSRIQ